MASVREAAGGPAAEARAYLTFEALRWPEGPRSCPHCGVEGRCRYLSPADGQARRTRTGARSVRRVWRCGHCRRQFSVLTGTIFEGTRVPLAAWLDAVTVLAVRAASAAEVAGVSHETARAMTGLVTAGAAAAEIRLPAELSSRADRG